MYYLYPASALFFSCLVLGSVLSLSAANWALVWVGLEINLLSFVPLVLMGKGGQSVEAGAKYFLAQVTGSGVFLIAPLMSMMNICIEVVGGVVLLGLMVKVGSAPTHQWFPSVIAGISWANGYIMITWQKLAPLLLAASVVNIGEFAYLMGIAILNGVMGAVGGINQTQLRPLLGYSSIVHLGWIVALMPLSYSGVVVYWIVYSVLLVWPILLVGKLGVRHVGVFDVLFGSEGLWVWMSFAVGVLSLAGMPPFSGFYLKVYVLNLLVEAGFMWVGLGLVFSSVIALSFYYELVLLSCVLGLKGPVIIDVHRSRFTYNSIWVFIGISAMGPVVSSWI